MDQSSSVFDLGKKRVLEGLEMSPLCVFPRTALITVKPPRCLLSPSPQKPHRVHHPLATQASQEENRSEARQSAVASLGPMRV